MDKKIKIHLADLANTKFGYSPATVPLAIGYLKAYADHLLPGMTDIRLFRTFETLFTAIKEDTPDLIGFSWYGWNEWLTINAARHIKSRYPEIITLLGGSSVSGEHNQIHKDLIEFPFIDVIIPDEGEIAFCNLLKSLIENTIPKKKLEDKIDGAFYLSKKKELITGNQVPSIIDINQIPSPYLQGHLDVFFENEELMPIIQTSRGCPYHCTFCASGKTATDRLRRFNIERVKQEISYLELHSKNRSIRFSDDNFGLFPEDEELSEFIRDKRRATGFPHGLRMYTNKVVNNRIKNICLNLRELIPLNISLQSITPHVMDKIKRKNISLLSLQEAVLWAHANNIIVTTEVIFGLPGETFDSFMDMIDKIIELKIDSITPGTLKMYRSTEVAKPESIENFKYKIKFSIAERGYTEDGDFKSVEIDNWASESSYFSFDDMIMFKKVTVLLEIIHMHGYFREMLYIMMTYGVKFKNLVNKILNSRNEYPMLNEKLDLIEKSIKEVLFDSPQEISEKMVNFFSGDKSSHIKMSSNHPLILQKIIIGEMIHSNNQTMLINEIFNAAISAFKVINKNADDDDFMKEMSFAKELSKVAIIPYWETPAETVTVRTHYDLFAWSMDNYSHKLSDYYSPVILEHEFKVRNIEQYQDFLNQYSSEPFYVKSEYFFRLFRSNNIRRMLVAPSHELRS